MKHRALQIGRWVIDFFFAVDSFDEEVVFSALYDAHASYSMMHMVDKLMKSGKKNTGFTYTNAKIKQGVVLIGPTTDSKEFLSTLVHEIHHVAVAIAAELGVDLEGEVPAYISGDSALDLADLICKLGCPRCRNAE